MTDLKRDYVIVLDKSGSMQVADCPGGQTRWQAAQESTLALAHKVAGLDPDGIDVYFFANTFKRHEGVGPDKVEQVFKEHEPFGGTNTAAVLNDVFEAWRENGKKPTTALVVTDGEPSSQTELENAIIAVTKQMDADEQLAISFLQIGRDEGAKKFLEHLDDGLEAKGAKFDIVDTKSFAAIEASGMTMTDVLVAAVED